MTQARVTIDINTNTGEYAIETTRISVAVLQVVIADIMKALKDDNFIDRNSQYPGMRILPYNGILN